MLSSPDLRYYGPLSHPSSDEAYLEAQKSIEKRAALVNSSTSVLSSIISHAAYLAAEASGPPRRIGDDRSAATDAEQGWLTDCC